MDSPSVPPSHATVTEDSSGSEYESEEEFFVTFDLTIPAPARAGPSTNPHVNIASKQQSSSIPAPFAPAASPPSRPDRFQLSDLDTPHPLISYNNRIWSGTWTQSVGTELHVVGSSSASVAQPPATGWDAPKRRTAGGYYIPCKDTSSASAFVGHYKGSLVREGQRKKREKVLKRQEEGQEAELGEDSDVGRIEGVGDARVHFVPLVVKEKEWTFEEQLIEKSSFLARLHKLQVEKGEITGEETMNGKRKRGAVAGGEECEGQGDQGGGSVGMGKGKEKMVVMSGYFAKDAENEGAQGREEDGGVDRRDSDGDVEMLGGYFAPEGEKGPGGELTSKATEGSTDSGSLAKGIERPRPDSHGESEGT